jgi:hypothetical protein
MQGGMTQDNEITAKTDDEMTVSTTNKIPNVPDQPATVNKIPLKVKSDGTTAATPANPPKVVGKETLKVSGQSFDCEIYENVTEVAGQKYTTKSWMAKKYPMIIKSEMNGAVSMELKEIK